MSIPEQLPDQSSDPPLRLLAAFQTAFYSHTPDFVIQSPGREMWIAACIGDPGLLTIHAPDLDRRTVLSYRSVRSGQTVLRRPLPQWVRFSAGIVLELYNQGIVVPGIRAVIAGEEPHGPRYHHAMGMAVAALWYDICQKPYDAGQLLELLERVRHDYLENPAGFAS